MLAGPLAFGLVFGGIVVGLVGRGALEVGGVVGVGEGAEVGGAVGVVVGAVVLGGTVVGADVGIGNVGSGTSVVVVVV